jgi:hypothetical protein
MWWLTPPLKGVGDPCQQRQAEEAAVNSTRNLRENLRDFSTLFSLWSRLCDRNG